MPFQNLVCPAAPLISLLPASFLKSAHSYLYSRRPPRPPWRFSLLHIRRSRQSAEHPFPLFLSLTAFRLTFPLPVSLSLSLCPSLSPPNSRFSSIPIIPNPPTLCHLPFSLSPFRPCRYSISPVPVFDSRSRSRFCSSRRHPHQLHHPHPPPACSRPENIPRRW